ncbi:MAG: SusC/RagA family TonB-linked outer membrane protein, partial [Candidatus Nephrothrix sp. EaCA]
MKNTRFLTLILFFSMLAGVAFGQTKAVVGTVRDENNKPVEFAAVSVKNTVAAAITNEKGEYAIDVPKDGKTLVFTYVGKETIEEVIGNRTRVDAVLISAVSTLDDVVIVGYGTVKKSDLTGSVASIKSDEVLRINPVSVEQGLQGKIAGVQVTQSDGAPGAGINIQVRGSNTFLGSSEPLYVIDGIPYLNNNDGTTPRSLEGDEKHSQNALSFLNPRDIESIEVLKDASATAIYGSRGANGVVLITTKKGKKGSDKIEVSLIDNFSVVSKWMNLLDAETFANLFNEAAVNANQTLGTKLDLPYRGQTNERTGVYYPSPEEFRGKSTDWQRAVFKAAHSQNLTVSASGAGDKGTHAFSFDYYKQNGIILNSDYIRKTGRVNLTRNIGKRVIIGTNTSYTHSASNSIKTGTVDIHASSGIIRAVLTYPPTIDKPFAPGAELGIIRTTDPLTYINSVQNKFISDHIFSANYFEVEILKQLKFRQNFGLNYSTDVRNQHYPKTTMEGRAVDGKASQSGSTFRSLVAESILTYSPQWKEHSLTIVGGLTRESSIYASTYAAASGFPND